MGVRSLRFRVYAVGLVCAAALGVGYSWLAGWPLTLSPLLVTLALACVVSEVLAVNLPNGDSISLGLPLGVCTIVLLGPTAGALVALLSNVPYFVRQKGTSPLRLVFNLGQITLSALGAGWIYLLSGGRILAQQMLVAADFPRMLVALVLAPIVCLLLNFALGFIGHSMIHDVSVSRVFREAFSWMIVPQIALGLLGIAIAQVLAVEGPAGFALFVIPLVVARQMHTRYLELRETYADTVRSLVAALEAKDPYTRGHSERVAFFTVALARAMSLEEREVERLEVAALLHDLGKIGISRAILSKPSALTGEEYSLVKQHPDIAARILESVPSLSDVLPVVQGHHERVDGAGYGMALVGDHIPLGARILAVADSYDAMTADRPYRSAYSREEARAELLRGRGTQFDEEVVDTFLSSVDCSDTAAAPYSLPQSAPSLASAADALPEASGE